MLHDIISVVVKHTKPIDICQGCEDNCNIEIDDVEELLKELDNLIPSTWEA